MPPVTEVSCGFALFIGRDAGSGGQGFGFWCSTNRVTKVGGWGMPRVKLSLAPAMNFFQLEKSFMNLWWCLMKDVMSRSSVVRGTSSVEAKFLVYFAFQIFFLVHILLLVFREKSRDWPLVKCHFSSFSATSSSTLRS